MQVPIVAAVIPAPVESFPGCPVPIPELMGYRIEEGLGAADTHKKGPYGSTIERYKRKQDGATHHLHRDGELS
jgi:hypothetical protein